MAALRRMPKPTRVEKKQAIEVPLRGRDLGCGAISDYLIDTNIALHGCVGTDAVLAKLAEHESEVLLSALSVAELQGLSAGTLALMR